VPHRLTIGIVRCRTHDRRPLLIVCCPHPQLRPPRRSRYDQARLQRYGGPPSGRRADLRRHQQRRRTPLHITHEKRPSVVAFPPRAITAIRCARPPPAVTRLLPALNTLHTKSRLRAPTSEQPRKGASRTQSMILTPTRNFPAREPTSPTPSVNVNTNAVAQPRRTALAVNALGSVAAKSTLRATKPTCDVAADECR
jgi:hypothetical protein